MTGVLGGAFDPPHVGHVALAEAAKRRFGLGRLLVLVSASPGHKDVVAPADDRLDMARLAFPDDDVELDPYARTIDMLRARALDDPLLILGADQLVGFATWKEPEAIRELARVAAGARPGYAVEGAELFELEPHDVASSDIRERVARGVRIDGLVPMAVEALIRTRGLYRATAGLH